MSDDRATALALTPVSQQTLARLDRYVAKLREWQTHTNLIANSTLPQLWTRHVADSLQLLALAPKARVWADLGSGAGFPGLAIACALADIPNTQVHLIESRQKKAAFLREAADAAGAPATVHAERAENCVDRLSGAEIVTARALAPLNDLCDLAFPLIEKGAVALFHKGQDVEAELTLTSKYWSIEADLLPSLTSSEGRIVRISRLTRHASKKKK